MPSLKLIDDTHTTIQEDDDNYETPDILYNKLIEKYKISPKLDVAADPINKKCPDFISEQKNALFTPWLLDGKPVDVWCNPPGSQQLNFISRAENQYLSHNMNILMILPSRVLATNIWHTYIEDKREYHAILGRPTFLKHGIKTKYPAMHAYVCVIWRAK